MLLGVVDLRLEWLPELLQQRNPVLFAARDGIEGVLEPGGEVVVDIGGEVLGEELVDDAPDIGRREALLVEFDVLALL